MNSPSFFKTPTITVAVFNPLVLGGGYLKTIDEQINSYSHTISIDGGFLSASISMADTEVSVDEWLSNGIGRHIVAYGSGGETIWEGFVDKVSVSLGNLTIERGSLTAICNRCMVMYTCILKYQNDGQPITASGFPTTIAEDETSQRKYGIWEQVINGATLETANAEYLRDTYIADNKEPVISHTPSLGVEAGSDITITLDCKGYIEWMTYVYENNISDVDNTSIETSDKIKLILTADPNSVFSTNQNNIDYNGSAVGIAETTNRKAIDIIKEMVSLGDGSNNRWMFGIYEDRTAYYKAFSSTIDYYYYISAGNQAILSVGQTEISPWNVRPGKIIYIPDTFMGGLKEDSDLRNDPRIMYLEQVTFTAPAQLDLQGKKLSRFEQLQAQQGLA